MANAIYRVTLASSRQHFNEVSGALVFAASSTDALDLLKGMHPAVPAATWDAATASVITANGGMAADATGLSAWMFVNNVGYYADATAGDTIEALWTNVAAAFNAVYPAGCAYVAGVTSSAGVLTIAEILNLGAAVITAGIGVHNGGLRIGGGTYKAITGLAPTVQAVQVAAHTRTITNVAPDSQAIPAGIGYMLREFRSPAFNDSPADFSAGAALQYGQDLRPMPT